MQEFKMTIGIILLILNSMILLTSVVGIVYRYRSAKETKNLKDLNIHYMVLFASMVFLFANLFAFYTGYNYYLKSNVVLSQDLMISRLFDRVGMFAVSILLLLIGKNVSENITEKK